MVEFGNELGLAIECCRRNFRHSAEPNPLSLSDLDWSHFLRLVQFHRIEALAWTVLSKLNLPDDVRATLSEAAMHTASQNLRAEAECAALLGDFRRAKVSLLFLKGLPLGALAYDNAALKSAIDIDLLIDPAELRAAAELLTDEIGRAHV